MARPHQVTPLNPSFSWGASWVSRFKPASGILGGKRRDLPVRCPVSHATTALFPANIPRDNSDLPEVGKATSSARGRGHSACSHLILLVLVHQPHISSVFQEFCNEEWPSSWLAPYCRRSNSRLLRCAGQTPLDHLHLVSWNCVYISPLLFIVCFHHLFFLQV